MRRLKTLNGIRDTSNKIVETSEIEVNIWNTFHMSH